MFFRFYCAVSLALAFMALPCVAQAKAQKTQPAVHKVAWSWAVSEGARQKVDKGVFYYTLEQGQIETGSVCDNYPYGSLPQKSCRKAAQAWFKKQCAKGMDAACSAAQMRP
ncbi:MAG: hypothetical protein RL217_596 [Pseudomonadota bacterium]|jgi:hypothetical protein